MWIQNTKSVMIDAVLQVFHDGQVSHYLDGRDEANSSWMRFVRCARHKKEQNMVVFQYHGCVYYRTIREILPGQELLVWYDTRYSQFMGVPVALSDSGSRGKSACVVWYFNTCEPPTHPSHSFCVVVMPWMPRVSLRIDQKLSWPLSSRRKNGIDKTQPEACNSLVIEFIISLTSAEEKNLSYKYA